LPSGLQTKPCMNFSFPAKLSLSLWQSNKLVYSKHKYRSVGQEAHKSIKMYNTTYVYNNYSKN
jgi:hypothetical protein